MKLRKSADIEKAMIAEMGAYLNTWEDKRTRNPHTYIYELAIPLAEEAHRRYLANEESDNKHKSMHLIISETFEDWKEGNI